jgi:uncharacterized protein DUF6299
MKALRVLIPATLVGALVPLATAAPAMAAPPPNDDSSGAIAVHLGERVEADTSQATTNAGDATLNDNCGAPATNASVWYKYTPSAKRNVALDVSESDYEAGLMVFDGTPSADSFLTCGPFEVGVRAKAGHTYYIMVFSDTAVKGGSLVMTVKNAPTPSVHVRVAKKGVAFRGGAARLHGSYSCTHADSGAEVASHLIQRAGRLKIQAQAFTGAICNGKRHHWSTRLVSPVGTYASGRAKARVRIISCGILVCRHDVVRRHVRLHWARGPHREWMDHPTKARQGRMHPLSSRHWPSK